jgi:predicted CXXCH cytochrome family protein
MGQYYRWCFQVVHRLFLFLAALLFIVVAGPRDVSAGQISILTPLDGKEFHARNDNVHLVLKLADPDDTKHLKVQNNGKSFASGVTKSFNNVAFVHYYIKLQPGKNVITITPGNTSIKVKYTPLRTLLAVNFDAPSVYIFHRESGVFPKECKSCHAKKTAAAQQSVQAPYGSSSPECYSCHKKVFRNSNWTHGPVANFLCWSCHQEAKNPNKIIIPSGKVDSLCFQCHVNERRWPEMAHVHGPVGTGDCTVCHNPHGDQFKSQLWADGKTDLCLACHTDKKMYANGGSVQFIHGILSGKGCIACHSPHATENRFQLYMPINELCSSCHPGVTKGDEHPVKGHPTKGKKDPRRPNREFGCTSCHNPHGSEYKFLLIGSHLGNRVCRKCHK